MKLKSHIGILNEKYPDRKYYNVHFIHVVVLLLIVPRHRFRRDSHVFAFIGLISIGITKCSSVGCSRIIVVWIRLTYSIWRKSRVMIFRV